MPLDYEMPFKKIYKSFSNKYKNITFIQNFVSEIRLTHYYATRKKLLLTTTKKKKRMCNNNSEIKGKIHSKDRYCFFIISCLKSDLRNVVEETKL